MSICPAFHGGLIQASSHILHLCMSDGVLNENLENVQLVIVLLRIACKSYKIKCLEGKKSHRRNYELCWVAWNPHLYRRQREQQGLRRGGNSKTYCHHLKNIITCLKSRKSELRPSRAPLSSCRWFLHTWSGWRKHRDGQHRPHVNSSLQPAPLGATTVLTRSNPAAQHPQHHRPLTSKSVRAAWGTSSPGSPGIMRPKTSHPEACWCESHCPSYSPYKTSSAWYSHRHSASISHCTTYAQGTWSCSLGRDCCWRMGRNHSVPHAGRQGFLHPAKPEHCSKPPSHSGREYCK